MIKIRLVGVAFLPVLLATGCASMNNTEKGALVGGGLGAGTGAIIGHALGHTGGGAAIGAGVGALAGGLAGHAIDKSEEKTQAQIAAATAQSRGPLGVTDVAQMAQQHISDEVIISQIRSTGSVFHLSATDISWLKANGVSDPVVMEMQATATRVPRRVYTAAPVYGPPVYQPVYVYEPPPPPVAVGVGFGYTHVGHYR
jgi:hypothetical protein